MPRTAADVPADASILCESCGYTLDGLPPGANCPECGRPAAESTTLDGRGAAEWEAGRASLVMRWLRTSAEVIFFPSRFFRALITRGPLDSPRRFAMSSWFLSAILFAASARQHQSIQSSGANDDLPVVIWIGLAALTFGALWITTSFAASLTAWEARHRGIRLPKSVVLRGLYYHAAHYLPVAALACITTFTYAQLTHGHASRFTSLNGYIIYLAILCGEVVLAAGYLFWTYWVAMRNMMYANR